MPNSIFDDVISGLQKSVPFAIGIIASVKGSTPQRQGAKALFFEDGQIVGTMGGGCLEAEVQKRAMEAIRNNRATQFEMVLDHDFGWDDGLICGGKVTCLLLPSPAVALPIFRELAPRDRVRTWGVTADFNVMLCDETASGLIYRETVWPPEQLWMAGGGHIARAVAPLAESVDFEVAVFEDRSDIAERRYFPPSTKLRVGNWDELLADKLSSTPTLGVIVTRGHQHDALVLSKWVQKPFAFLGMIGSRRKRNVIFEKFITDRIATKEQLDRVACPVGLPIGDVTVEEIALSIVSQLVQNRSERRISQQVARNIKSPSLIKARAA